MQARTAEVRRDRQIQYQRIEAEDLAAEAAAGLVDVRVIEIDETLDVAGVIRCADEFQVFDGDVAQPRADPRDQIVAGGKSRMPSSA